MSANRSSHHAHEHFSPGLFFLTVVLTVAALCVLLRVISPSTWHLQFEASFPAFVGAFAAISLLNCFVEFFFHRYVLHRPAIPGLSRFYRQHTLHHALTRIGRKHGGHGEGLVFVENKFPIVEDEQGEGSFFPWYALAAFAALLTPVLIVLQWLAPSFPWFFGGFGALAVSLVLYEVLHAINHWPIERWEPLLNHPRYAWFWRPAYGFHLRHHAVIDCNESISGFFGLPLADWLFGTCVIPPTLYAEGETWNADNFTTPRPRALIRWLDHLSSRAIARRRTGRTPRPAQSRAKPSRKHAGSRG